MPGYLSHYLFSIGTARRLQDSKAYPILTQYRKAFCLGGEGPDIFLYYFPSHLHKNISLGSRLHKTKTKEFLSTGIRYITTKNNYQEKEILYTYLSGLLCHYTLDTIAHPYIEAFANPSWDKIDQSLRSYQHCSLETTLDANLLFKYLRKFPSEQDYVSITNPKGKERHLIATFLSLTCNKVYGSEAGYDLTSASQMYRAVSLFPYTAACLKDTNGIKKPLFKTIEKLLHIPYRPSCIISSDDLQMNLDIMNLTHRLWSSPFEPQRIRRESFIDLFNLGIDSAYKRCQILYSILFQCEDKQQQHSLIQILIDDLGNLSYNTGTPL